MKEMVMTIGVYIYFLMPILVTVYFLYTIVDLIFSLLRDAFSSLFNYEEEEEGSPQEPEKRSYKGGKIVVDTFSDAFKLSSPEFED